MTYIIKEPTDLLDDKKCHRYPFVAHQCLQIDSSAIYDCFLLTNKEYNEIHPPKEPSEKEEEPLPVPQESEKVYDVIGEKYEDDKKEDSDTSLPEIINEEEEKNKNRIELFDYLLDFVMNDDKPLNNVLAGYFSTVFLFLYDKNNIKIIKYMYSYRIDALEKIVKHSNLKALSLVAEKLLDIDTNKEIFNENDKENPSLTHEELLSIIGKRNELLSKMITSISINDDMNFFIIDTIKELCLNNEQVLTYILNSQEVLEFIFSILKKNTNNEDNKNDNFISLYCSLLSFIGNLCQSILNNKISLPTEDKTQQNEINPFYGKIFTSSLSSILLNFTEKKSILMNSTGKECKCLGSINLGIIELVNELFPIYQNLQYKFDFILIRNGFIKQATNFFFQYPLNDIYKQQYLNLIKKYIKPENINRQLSKYLFTEIQLHKLLLNKISSVPKFSFESGKEINDPIYPFIISLCYKLNSLLDNQAIKIKDRKGSFAFLSTETNDNTMLFDKIKNCFALFTEKAQIKKANINEYLDDKWEEEMASKVSPVVEMYENKLGSLVQDDNSLDDSNIIDDLDDSTPSGISTNNTNNNNNSSHEIQVDEIDLGNYSDNKYWKSNDEGEYGKKILEEALKELEI